MEPYEWLFYILIFLTLVYTLGFAWQTWKNKNRLGAFYVFGLAISVIALAIVNITLL